MKLEDFKNIPFRMQDLSAVFPDCANLAMKAKRLEHHGLITRLKKGLYVANPAVSRLEISPFLLANHIYGPSYVSQLTALRYYGLIPEAVYTIQSMTTGIARSYDNPIGSFTYVHVPADYYTIGVDIRSECGVSFLIATPEKALCDLIVYTPYLNLKSQRSLREYLEEDIRFDTDELKHFNANILAECLKASRKKTMITQLIKLFKFRKLS